MKLCGVLVVLVVVAVGAHILPEDVEDDGHFIGYDAEIRQYVNISYEQVYPEEWHHRMRRGLATDKLGFPDWPKLWVKAGGVIVNHTDTIAAEKNAILVAATPLVLKSSHQRAADIVAMQTRHMNPQVFSRLTNAGTTLAVFGHQEDLTVYPTFKHMQSRDCGGSCSGGRCRSTCASLGRKIESLVGIGGTGIAAIKEDNAACLDFDGYRKGESILVHEFAHTIKTGFLGNQTQLWSNAYNAAKSGHIWNTGSYAMSNKQEFWAEASQVWFGATIENRSFAGGMNLCHGSGPVCQTAKEGQEFLKQKQPAVYQVLLDVYNNGDPNIDHNFAICPKGRGIDWSYH